MSLFTMYTVNEPSGLLYSFHHEGFHPDMELSILIHWRGDHKLLYYSVMILCQTHRNFMRITDSTIFTKVFSKNYKRTHF